MTMTERPLVFSCRGDELIGILALPASAPSVGVVVVVGGPQYRAGSHRQFVKLGRALAQAGIACLRFDYRGMGDSGGALRTFESVDDDVAAAIAALEQNVPSVRHVVLWALCDGASAAFMAARTLPGITGIVALNPWVRDETSLDRALVKHYYARRFVSWGFWRKVFSGEMKIAATLGEFLRRLRTASGRGATGASSAPDQPARYQDRMWQGLTKLKGPGLIILSGKDLTAQEYETFSKSEPRWKKALAANPRFATHRVALADHTFSNDAARVEVERLTCAFVQALTAADAPASRSKQVA